MTKRLKVFCNLESNLERMPISTLKNFHETIRSILTVCFPATASASRLRKIVEKLPDDILIDIISRLAAKDALNCRCVCKEWRALTSTQEFLILQIRRSIPLILAVVLAGGGQFNQFLLDKWREPAGTESMIYRVQSNPDYRTESSHGGLIVMQRGMCGNFMILNPINSENVNITVTDNLSRSEIVGVFFHPTLEDYCTFWRIVVSSPRNPLGKPERVVYKLLNLGSNSKPCWRDIRNQWSHRSSYTSSVFVEEYVYWMISPEPVKEECSYGIMEFGIKSEEVTLMPCPASELMSNDFNISMNLLNIDGLLSLVLISPCKRLVNVNIWTLKNRSNQLWTSSNYSFTGEVYSGYRMLVPIAISDGELVLDSDDTLFVCNLKFGTTRAFGNRFDRTYEYLSHVTSLVSLRTCKSNICMDEEGEIE